MSAPKSGMAEEPAKETDMGLVEGPASKGLEAQAAGEWGKNCTATAGTESQLPEGGPDYQLSGVASSGQGASLGYWQPQPWPRDPPQLRIKYDGDPARLALFVHQVIIHMNCYAHLYPSRRAMVHAVTVALDGEAGDWVADLYSDNARELGDVSLLLDALQSRFEDVTWIQRAEGELISLKQGPRQVLDYIREFRRLADKLRHWPEQVLVLRFKAGLNRGLRKVCEYRGLPPQLNEWFRATREIEAQLRELRPKRDLGPRPRRFHKRQWTVERTAPPVGEPPVGTRDWPACRPMLCFKCNQPGHRATECPAPTPKGNSKDSGPGKTVKNSRKIPAKSRTAHQMGGALPTRPDDGEMLAKAELPQVPDDSDDEGNRESMVSAPIWPFVISMCLTASGRLASRVFEVLIDSGCTWCLLSLSAVNELGVRTWCSSSWTGACWGEPLSPTLQSP